MSRKVHGPAPGGCREYLPESFENRGEPDPIVVSISDPTEAEKRALTLLQTDVEFEGGEIVRDSDGSPRIQITLAAMAEFQKKAVLAHVSKVTNYEVRGVSIIDGASLAEHGETELIAEVALEITTGLSMTEDEKKPLSGFSDSTQAEIPRSNGSAENVQEAGSLSGATVTGDQTSLSYTLPS